jgi:LacI family transcriptional regulator
MVTGVKKRPTINDVARRAGVSIKTVSRVFNDEPNVRPHTRDKVLQAAAELRYRPNLSARRLAANRAFVIGMLYDNPKAPDYVAEVQDGVLRACKLRGYDLLIHPCDSGSPSVIDEVLDLSQQATVDGLIVLQPVSDNQRLVQMLHDENIPAVRVSQRAFPGIPRISVADEDAAAEMTDRLMALGHRRIGFIMGHPDHGSSHDRLQGYRSALARHGIGFDGELVEQGYYDFDSGYSCANRLLALRPRPTAIFASNDHMAMATLTAAHEIGIAIPNDLSVAGFDDTSFAEFAWPPLTTVRQPVVALARLAADVLLDRLQGRQTETCDHQLRAEVVDRASIGPATRVDPKVDQPGAHRSEARRDREKSAARERRGLT